MELCAYDSAIESVLNLLSLNEDSFNTTHSIQEIFNQESLLDFDRELTQRLLKFLLPCSTSHWPTYLSRLKLAETVMIEVRSFEQPIRKVGNGGFDNSENREIVGLGT